METSMKNERAMHWYRRLSSGIAGCLCIAASACTAEIGEPGENLDEEGYEPAEAVAENDQSVTCSPQLKVFPVRGKHNTGYDKNAGNTGSWTCNAEYSNSDFIGGDHLGIDIWGAPGTPIAATADGTVKYRRTSAHAGNYVRINDACGWGHYSGHLASFAPGIKEGQWVKAGTIIGYLGNTGTSSNGVYHLHFSLFPDGNYNAGVNPHPYLKAVEKNVCTSSAPAPGVPDAYQPIGMFDHLDARGGGKIGLWGWAMDPDTKTKAIPVHVVVWGSDGVKRGPYVRTANQHRPDVGSAYPGYGNYHGYADVFGPFPKGSTKVQVFAIDSSNTANDYKSIGVKWINVY